MCQVPSVIFLEVSLVPDTESNPTVLRFPAPAFWNGSSPGLRRATAYPVAAECTLGGL